MKTFASIACSLGILLAYGCAREASPPSISKPSTEAAPIDGSKYLLNEEPSGAEDVIAARQGAEDGEDILVVGRIGGASNPWVDGRAAFTIVDRSLKACSDIPGDPCAKPWDYCCETSQLPNSTALVKVVDEQGEMVKADARELLDVKELATVVVQGKAQRDESGNLTVLASGVHVKK